MQTQHECTYHLQVWNWLDYVCVRGGGGGGGGAADTHTPPPTQSTQTNSTSHNRGCDSSPSGGQCEVLETISLILSLELHNMICDCHSIWLVRPAGGGVRVRFPAGPERSRCLHHSSPGEVDFCFYECGVLKTISGTRGGGALSAVAVDSDGRIQAAWSPPHSSAVRCVPLHWLFCKQPHEESSSSGSVLGRLPQRGIFVFGKSADEIHFSSVFTIEHHFVFWWNVKFKCWVESVWEELDLFIEVSLSLCVWAEEGAWCMTDFYLSFIQMVY